LASGSSQTLPANTVESLIVVGHAAKYLDGVAEWPSFRGQHPQVVDIIKQRFLHFKTMKTDNAKGRALGMQIVSIDKPKHGMRSLH